MQAIDKFRNRILCGDALDILKKLPSESIDCIITSPPYWQLRDYGIDGQIGLEPTLDEYLEKLLNITKELKRVLKPSGVLFWNHGDSYGTGKGQSYGGLKKGIYAKMYPHGRQKPKMVYKSLCMQNYRLAMHMVDEQGWILRNIIIWYKTNHLPSSAKDRFTNAYEPVFFFVKQKKYWFDLDAIRVPHKSIDRRFGRGRIQYKQRPAGVNGGGTFLNQHPLGKNPGDVWAIPTRPFTAKSLGFTDTDHYATFPEDLVTPMIKAGCPQWICNKCGRPRERIVNRKVLKYKAKPYNAGTKFIHHGEGKSTPVVRVTVGWTDCGCNAGWHSGIVLDPFAGVGTTCMVAKRLGRDYIGIDLNPRYCEIARRRLETVPVNIERFLNGE